MRRWSKLQREIYKITADNINFQIHCVAYRMDSQMGSTNLPRYWITLDKETIFDYPKQFITEDGGMKNLSGFIRGYHCKKIYALLHSIPCFIQDLWIHRALAPVGQIDPG